MSDVHGEVSGQVAGQFAIREKTLFDVLRDMWAARRSMVIFGVVGLVLAIAFLGIARGYKRADMILSPANPMGGLVAASLPAQEGTISVQDEGGVHDLAFLRFENTYMGPRVAAILLKDQSVMAGLAKDRAFVFSGGFVPGNAQELAAYIKKRVHIEPVSGTPLRRLRYAHPDGAFAALFLTHIYAVTDELIRAQALREVQARAAYLDKTIAETADANHRRVLTDILMIQERLRMLVSIDQPFSAAIIEPASALPRRAWPQVKLIVPLFVFLGMLLGFVVHGVRHYGR